MFCRYQGVNIEHLKTFVDRQSCTQFLRYDCYHSVISPSGIMWAYWKDRYGNKVNYWPGGEANRHGCACGVDKSCAGIINYGLNVKLVSLYFSLYQLISFQGHKNIQIVSYSYFDTKVNNKDTHISGLFFLPLFFTCLYSLGSSKFCNCDSNDHVWRHDEGTIRDNQLLPVTALHLVDTQRSDEMGFFTLGPLICV